MPDIAMLPHPVEGRHRHYDGSVEDVRVLGLAESDEDGGYWLVIDEDGKPSWADFSMVTFSRNRALL